MFIETEIFDGYEQIRRNPNSTFDGYKNGDPIYHKAIINTDNICCIDCESHTIYFTAPDGGGMTTYGLHKQISTEYWNNFYNTLMGGKK